MPEVLPDIPDPAPTPDTPPTPKPADTPAPKTTQLTQEQYDALMRKAAAYDAIEQDGEISSKVVDHFRAKAGKVTRTVPETTQKPSNEPVDDPRFKALEDRIGSLTRQLAQREINDFKSRHPDVEEYKEDMARLVNAGLSLDEAYRYSKGAKSQTLQKPASGTPPVSATTETNRNAGVSEESSDAAEEEILRKINDPKATPRMDDALTLAWGLSKARAARSN